MNDNVIVIAICDDEKEYSETVFLFCKKIIEQETGENVKCLYFSNGESLLKYEYQIDILLLDIKMNQMNGITVKNLLYENGRNTKIIFLTNYMECMKEAFGKCVYGFADKGNYKEELPTILKYVLKDIYKERAFILAEDSEKRIKIPLKDIYYMKSSGNYLDIYTEKNSYYVRRKISECEVELKSKGFYRVHKSYMVNFEYISMVYQHEIELINMKCLPISRGTCQKIRKAYMDYLQKRG